MRRPLGWIVCAAGIVLAACAHAPPPLHATRLKVEQSSGAVVAFVPAQVAGHPLMLLLDTGAVRSILPEGFVRAHKLPTKSPNSADRYEDGNGHLVWMQRVDGVPVQFEGETTGGTLDFLMGPSDDASWGILAPQDLVRPGFALVIDLGREDLRYETEEAALKRVGAEASAPLRELDFHSCLIEGLFQRTHRVITMTINGVPSEMMVDTGCSRTVLARNNPAIASMLARQGTHRTTTSVSSTGKSLLVNDVPVEFSGTSFVVPVLVHPASQLCGRGELGADVLRHCTLVWGYSSLWATCRAPPPGE